MQLIKSNPYRTVGLLVGATAREQTRQTNRLIQFIDAEQEPDDDFSFPALGKIVRTVENVTDSVSKLNLDSDKMNASLFWFYNGNSITDEPAFDALKGADIDQAINIWSKLTSTAEVTQRNASAFSNLGTLYLSQNSNENTLEKGISLKLKFLESDFIKDFKALATDETYKTTKKELQLIFLNQIQTDIEKSGRISSDQFFEILSKQTFSAKQDFLNNSVQKSIEQIEQKIEDSKNKRKLDKSYSILISKTLIDNTTKELSHIKSILGVSNLKYSSIADKVANELLQCSIDFFNHYQEIENDIDYFMLTYNLAEKSQSIAVGSLVKERISDSLKTLKEMKDKELTQAIQVLQSIKDSYNQACLQIDKHVDELQFDTRPGFNGGPPVKWPKFDVSINWSKVEEMKRNTLNWDKVVELVRESIPQKNVDKIKNVESAEKISKYKILVDFLISKLNYSQINKVQYICYWKNVSIPRPTTPSSGGSSGCYIATMAYGNYDHPQVMILRQFRDDVLSKSQFGKWFIKTYYFYSPKLVAKLKNKTALNSLIRRGLNQIIKIIK